MKTTNIKKLIWILGLFQLCFSFKNNVPTNYVQSFQDSILFQVGILNNNESFFLIKNLHKNRLVVFDTTNIDYDLVDIENGKCLMITTNPERNSVSAITSLDENEMIQVNKKHLFTFNQIGFVFNVVILNSKNIYIYDKEVNDTVLDYKDNKMIELFLFNR